MFLIYKKAKLDDSSIIMRDSSLMEIGLTQDHIETPRRSVVKRTYYSLSQNFETTL